MKTLDDAWKWYKDVQETLKRMDRVGTRYWDVIPWDQSPWRADNQFSPLMKEEITDPARNGLRSLDDLAIVLLFSVFEAIVRGIILDEVEFEQRSVRHRVIRHALEAAREQVSEGSFYRVLESYKGTNDSLIEEVNQVRRFRNWVAHGKRSAEPSFVSPVQAYDRLTRFLEQFFARPTVTGE